MATDSVVFNQRLAATTYTYLENNFLNNVWDSNRTLKILQTKKGFKVVRPFGRFLAVPLDLLDDGASQFIPELGGFVTPNVSTANMAQFQTRTLVHPITFSDEEIMENMSEEKMIDLTNYKLQMSQNSMTQRLAKAIFNLTPGTDDLNSLNDIVGTADLGSVAVATYANWAAQVDTTTTAFTAKSFETLYNKCIWDTTEPDIIATTQRIYAQYVATAGNALRYMDGDAANLGFEVVQYKGAALYWDRAIPGQDSTPTSASDYTYMLNSPKLNLYVQAGRDYYIQKPQIADNQLGFRQVVIWRGQLVPRSRREHGKFTAMVAV